MANYRVKHKRQNIVDFQNDCHRFNLWYDGKKTEVSCYGAMSVFFENDSIPEDIKYEVQKKIYNMIDKNESKWSVPKGAREIADAYCAE